MQNTMLKMIETTDMRAYVYTIQSPAVPLCRLATTVASSPQLPLLRPDGMRGAGEGVFTHQSESVREPIRFSSSFQYFILCNGRPTVG
jgi:hypothetical protein